MPTTDRGPWLCMGVAWCLTGVTLVSLLRAHLAWGENSLTYTRQHDPHRNLTLTFRAWDSAYSRFGTARTRAVARATGDYTQRLLDGINECVHTVSVLPPWPTRTATASSARSIAWVKAIHITPLTIQVLRNAIWTSPLFWASETTERLFTVVHECTHIMFRTDDYAYHWEAAYDHLSPYELVRNADTLAVYIMTRLGLVVGGTPQRRLGGRLRSPLRALNGVWIS